MNYEKILDTYSLNYIIEYSDLTEAEVLQYLVEEEILELPPLPVDAQETPD